MTDTSDTVWPSPDERNYARLQAQELCDRAREGSLRFQAYLPPEIALWLLDHIENGSFHDPSEAAFVLFREAKELEPHADLRSELLKRMMMRAADDPGPIVPFKEVMARVEAIRKSPRPEPAVWKGPEGS